MASQVKLTSWNYRVIDFGETRIDRYALHEVYYEDGRPVSYSIEPATFSSEFDDDHAGHTIGHALMMALHQGAEQEVIPVSAFAS